ncbi:hypothetical protein [Amycolatopsis anabasis]|uniref:hypothetical protein n=1 Tax=Amycolatopsis anabasis TaxID=1840409 RepID=UPI00131B42DE|nr:hypothetical protein [Amycolatopsis anabasis]
MTHDFDRLYELLPSVYRRRDAEQGGPLKALLEVINEQADLLGADIDQLYEDWFIETCQDWVTPYLGDLVGYRVLPGSGETLAGESEEARRLLAAIASRRDVAHTVGNRRRKGTLALLEQLAADVAGWPARAVEFRRLLGVTQAVRLHGRDPRADRRRLHRGRLAGLHEIDALDRLDGPFDRLAHTVDVRRVNSARGRGKHDIPAVGLYVWRLRPYSITHGPAYCEDRARTHFTFSILGNDTPLLTKPVAEPAPTHVADETNVPAFIRRRAFAERTAHYYGPGKSLCVYRNGDEPVPLSEIVPADLSGWRYTPKRGQVAIDPVLGRIAFPSRGAPDTGVWVSYHYGFSDDLGGGEYMRPQEPPDAKVKVYRVGPGHRERIMQAVEEWRRDKAEHAEHREAIIELTDTGAYQEQIEIPLDRGDRLTVRAAQGARPVLRLLDWYSNRPDALRLVGTGQGDPKAPLPRIVFDGLLITGRSVRVQGPIGQVVLRHSTLVPGWSLDEHCHPEHEEEASVELFDTPACLQVERSIFGTILVNTDEVAHEPNRIWLSDSILDAAGEGLAAVTGPDDRHAHAVFNARRSTVLGQVLTHAIGLVENSIVDGKLLVARRQSGCVRFSYLRPGSRTPPRFHCEPDHSKAPRRVVPRFTGARYGTPGYAQLSQSCPEEIRRGAEDGAEMGAFHDLFQPQREDNLRLRLDEYTPAGCDAGILIAT